MEQEQGQVAPIEVNGGDEQQGGSIDIGAGSDGPPSIIGVGPPSPLTGCYLLIVIGEPHSQDHKDIILQRLIKGFLSWDVVDCHVDLEEELHTITLQALEGEEGKHVLSLECYGCISYVSFDDCAGKAIKVDCDTVKPEVPWIPESNGTFACGKGSGSSPNGQTFIKTCVPKMAETDFCALLTSQTVGGTVDVCKVCTENLCNTGTELVLTGALLLLTVGLIFRV